MGKYSRTVKLTVARRCNEGVGFRNLAKELGISSGQVRYWSLVYRLNGEDSFQHSEMPYTAEFKKRVIDHIRHNGHSITYTSALFDLSSPGILTVWLRHLDHSGIARLKPRHRGRATVKKKTTASSKAPKELSYKELQEELEYLRAENAVLKKLQALAQEKQKRIEKKRQ